MSKVNYYLSAILLSIVVLLTLTQCNDPSFIGSELFEEDRTEIGQVKTTDLRIRTIKVDSVRTFHPTLGNQFTSYLFGKVEDPFFGHYESSLYIQPRTEGYVPAFFKDIILDSFVLILPIDTVGLYGNTEQRFGMEVYQVMEDLPRTTLYSNNSFAVDSKIIGEASFIPNLDSADIVEFSLSGQKDTIRRPPHLRIPLDIDFIRELISFDSTDYLSDRTLLSRFKGLYLKPTVENQGLLSFGLLPNSSFPAGIYIYYRTDSDTSTYRIPLRDFSVRSAHYDHEYTGSSAGEIIAKDFQSDSLFLVQGLSGLLTEIEIPLDPVLQGVIVNNVRLEITAAPLPGGDIFNSPTQLLLFYKDTTTGAFIPLDDALLAGSNLELIFGGNIIKESGKSDKYVMNFSSYFQKIIDGTADNTIYLGINSWSQRGERAAFLKNGENGIKLNIIYTKL